MSTFLIRPWLAAASAAVVALTLAAPAGAVNTKPIDIRVVQPNSSTAAEHVQYTGAPARFKASKRADCFGEGNEGSGKRRTVRGPNGLGVLLDAADAVRTLDPVLVTDAFFDDGFGYGVCSIGGFKASGSSYWYVKRNHVGSQVSASQLELKAHDDVLWYLTPSFPPEDELFLKAPARATTEQPYTVKVQRFSDDGTRSPAEGATVDGALAPTGADGKTTVVSATGTERLQAQAGSDIPSNLERVCVAPDKADCPRREPARIFGSSVRDKIKGTLGDDTIKAAGGDDRVDIRRPGSDRVNCGGGRDKVITTRGDRDDRIARSCERVVKRK